MQTLWQYFRISMALVAASALCGALAIQGIDELEKRKPPDAVALKAIGTAWSEYHFNLRAAGPYRFDLELDPLASTPAHLCEAGPPVTAIDCRVPPGRADIEWRIENDQRAVIGTGNLGTSGSRLYFGSFHWLELGQVSLSTGENVLRLRGTGSKGKSVVSAAADLPWARIRIWRGARDEIEARESARQTSNWMFATICALILLLFAAMIEYAVWKRQRAPSQAIR